MTNEPQDQHDPPIHPGEALTTAEQLGMIIFYARASEKFLVIQRNVGNLAVTLGEIAELESQRTFGAGMEMDKELSACAELLTELKDCLDRAYDYMDARYDALRRGLTPVPPYDEGGTA